MVARRLGDELVELLIGHGDVPEVEGAHDLLLAKAAGREGENVPSYRELCGLDDLGVFAPALAALNDDPNNRDE